jgi:hypothetical protein
MKVELIQQLVSQLGVQENQAKGGAGLLFKLAKERLGGGEFSQVARSVPGAEELIKDAPQGGGGIMGAVGGLASKFGGKAGEMGNMASLAGGFSKLGLDSGMIGKFIPIVLSYVQGTGGNGAKNLLQKALQPGK